ncbi:hypothetical protein E3N88_04701 [Mikania micrantha]|uniref:UspA domain-containing protein n=1 Tax=Mikania micrantha TaxID=192012 RepID=A0A5N6PW35_9ASTR|nr:hypothetical protein E3N88_04701 [Mikania micrantha]
MAENHDEHFSSDDNAPPPINLVNLENYEISRSHHEIVEEDDTGDFRGSRVITQEDKGTDLYCNEADRNVSDVVYVVTWTETAELLSASMDALIWTLGSDLRESTIVYLVHVFPELRFIPTPLGRLPISQANPEQKESYVSKERSKRGEHLHQFLSMCSSSKVQVETVLIESDMEAKAILDLIPILNIRKLVMGTTKSNLRKLENSSRKGGGGGTLDQILHNAPKFCEVKVICEGKEVSLQDESTHEPPLSPSSTAPSPPHDATLQPMQDHTNGSVRCNCFKL